MTEIEDVRKKKFESNVTEDITIEYHVNYGSKSESVESVYGTVKKGDVKVGSASYEAGTKDMHRTFSPFNGTSIDERQAIDLAINEDLGEILTSK